LKFNMFKNWKRKQTTKARVKLLLL